MFNNLLHTEQHHRCFTDTKPLRPLKYSLSLMNYKHARKFLTFSTFFVLALLIGASFLFRRVYSNYNPPITHDGAAGGTLVITGRNFLSMNLLRVRQEARAVDHRSRAKEVRNMGEALYCDRSHHRTDVCVAKGGDVRVVGGGRKNISHGSGGGGGARVYEVVVLAEGVGGRHSEEIIRPYTRKWEESVMNTIDQVKVIWKEISTRHVRRRITPTDAKFLVGSKQTADNSDTRRQPYAYPDQQRGQNVSKLQQAWKEVLRGSTDQEQEGSDGPLCDVHYKVPAILFSTGGYTGNVYHEFNDGLIPLYITAQKYPKGQVVIILLEYHHWWMTKYAEVIAQITSYPVIDIASDKRVHCFPEITVGLNIHDELAIHDDLDADHVGKHRSQQPAPSMSGFQAMLRSAYLAGLQNKANKTTKKEISARADPLRPPKLVVISRSSPRALLNEQDIVSLAKEIGFAVEVLLPKPSTEMVDIYSALSTCDVMLGVHGAAMTHLLFMRPRATFIQVVPLGTDWAAATYYGEPAEKLGLIYVPYKVRPQESSLWNKYASNDPVLMDPDSVNSKGWWETKRIYLEGQDLRLSLPRMREVLSATYTHHLHH